MAGERAALDALGRKVDGQIVGLFFPLLLHLTAALRATPGAALTPARVSTLSAIVAVGLRRVFGASPADPFAGGQPRVPFARTVAEGVQAASRLAVPDGADADAALARATSWRDPNGHTLSARVWRNGEDIRERVDTILAHHLQAGTDPAAVADELARYLTARDVRGRVQTVAGEDGRFAARRLALNEINRAHGLAVIDQAARRGGAVRWEITGAHPESDECDQLAAADNYGLGPGTYPADRVPDFPAHVSCRCVLVPVARGN